MAVYSSLLAANFAKGALTESDWEGTRGKQIMDALAVSPAPMPFLEDRVAVAMDLYHNAMQRHWTWVPTGSSPPGAPLLDGADMSGECTQLASGFAALLRAPAPFGFGLAADQIDRHTVEWPEDRDGVYWFVAKHRGSYFGLSANVLRADWKTQHGAARFHDLYAWGNHKVVKCTLEGRVRYFDPCYNNVYLQLSDMADYVLTDPEFAAAVKGGVPVVVAYSGRNRIGGRVKFQNPLGVPDLCKLSGKSITGIKDEYKTPDGRDPALIAPS